MCALALPPSHTYRGYASFSDICGAWFRLGSGFGIGFALTLLLARALLLLTGGWLRLFDKLMTNKLCLGGKLERFADVWCVDCRQDCCSSLVPCLASFAWSLSLSLACSLALSLSNTHTHSLSRSLSLSLKSHTNSHTQRHADLWMIQMLGIRMIPMAYV